MKIQNITNKGTSPSKVSVVVSYNKSPKTFNLIPGEIIYISGDFKSLITQAMRVQKQKGLIDFTDENEPVDELVPTFSLKEDLEIVEENKYLETNESASIDIFDIALEEVQKEEEKKEVPKRGKGRPKGSYKLSSKRREAAEKKSQENDK